MRQDHITLKKEGAAPTSACREIPLSEAIVRVKAAGQTYGEQNTPIFLIQMDLLYTTGTCRVPCVSQHKMECSCCQGEMNVMTAGSLSTRDGWLLNTLRTIVQSLCAWTSMESVVEVLTMKMVRYSLEF